jgi:glycosyltransferase involved in cell wall biosynthesis
MKVLHLFSNCKWTGPAEPALNLCCQLRALGMEIAFACAPDAGKSVNMVVESARARGIEPVLDFHLRKHRHPLKNFQDVRRLRRYLGEHPVDIVHCHLDNDHEIAARALRGLDIPLVRTSYEGVGLVPNRRRRARLARTAVLIEPSEMAREHDLAAYGMRPDQVVVVPNAIDTQRFDPERPLQLAPPVIRANTGIQEREGRGLGDVLDSRFRGNDGVGADDTHGAQSARGCSDTRGRDCTGETPVPRSLPALAGSIRAHWNIPADAYVVGIVARMQTHRHFEDLLQAMRGVVDELPHARLIIVGRGTHQEKVAREPVRQLGLDKHVIFTGYVEGDAFVAAIAAMDVGVYLVPGSDGTCRAAREILAMGKPLVVADRGMLREIVLDGVTGCVTNGSPASLRSALVELGSNGEKRMAFARASRLHACTRFALPVQGACVQALYETVLASKTR